MEVVLLEKIRKLGNLGDRAKVRSGYARNYLLPQGKAVLATAENIADFEAKRELLEKAADANLAAAQAKAVLINEKVISITAKSSEEGRLYGSIGTREIAEATSAATTAEVKKSEVLLPLGVIRQLGEYDVALKLHTDVTVMIKLQIVAEK